MTLTLELPKTLAERLTPLPENERQEYAIAWLMAGAEKVASLEVTEEDEPWEMTEEDVAAIQEGIDDLEAGRHRPLSEFIAEREAFWKERGVDLKNAR